MKNILAIDYGERFLGLAVRTAKTTIPIPLKVIDSKKDINLYINSPGGLVTAGLAMYDTIQYIRCPVHTVCIGQASSAGSLILASGKSGHRYALPHAKIMIHQPSGGFSGQATDIKIHAEEILKTKKRLNEIYQKHTNISINEIEKAMERDRFFDPEEALKFGLIDKIISNREDI